MYNRHRIATKAIGAVHAGTPQEELLVSLNVARDVALEALQATRSTEIVVAAEHRVVVPSEEPAPLEIEIVERRVRAREQAVQGVVMHQVGRLADVRRARLGLAIVAGGLTVFAGFLRVTDMAVVALEVPLAVSLRDRVDSEVRGQASSQADVLAATASDLLAPGQRARLQGLVATSAARLRARVLVVDGRGRVLVDSGGPRSIGQDFSARPEIATALRGRSRQERRHSATLGTDLLATAVPVVTDGRTAGAVRVTQDLAAVRSAERRTVLVLVLVGAVVLALGLAAGAVLAARIAGPVRRLEATARRVADGDLDARTTPEGSAEQRSLARSVNAMTERLAALLGRQRRFVADASHQLRTPLAGLRLRLENLRADADRGVATPAQLDAALDEVDRLAAIVTDLLELSRIERESAAGERATADAIAAAHRAAERWRAAASAGGGRVLVDVRTATARAPWSGAALDRMLDALVENALLHGGPGRTVRVVVGADEFAVEDDGPGVDPGERERVFERFHRGGAAQTTVPGTGLGLAIVRELAESGGGSVRLQERPGGGTVALVDFGTRDRVGAIA